MRGSGPALRRPSPSSHENEAYGLARHGIAAEAAMRIDGGVEESVCQDRAASSMLAARCALVADQPFLAVARLTL